MPRFRLAQRLRKVKFIDCSLPDHTYEQVLDTLNVHVLQHLEIEDSGELTARHLSGLECSTGAETRCDAHRLEALALVRLQLSENVFQAVPNLRRLRLEETHFDRLDLLPATLEELHLNNAHVQNLPLSTLSRFTSLSMLTVNDEDGTVTVEASDTIEKLSLEAGAVYIDITSLPKVKELRLSGWRQRRPERFKSCASLESLILENVTAEWLPDDWVIQCRSLSSLSIEEAPSLSNVSRYALRGAVQLRSLELTETALQSVPQGLLDDAKKLDTVNLSSNNLISLPPSLFVRCEELQALDLSDNKLRGEVLKELGALESLRELRLAHNPGLGDACPDHAHDHTRMSPLAGLQKLRVLVLRDTNCSMLCRDWTERLPLLALLDLAQNRITRLAFSDIQFRPKVTVDLSHNPVQSLLYTRDDYRAVVASYDDYCSEGGRHVSHARFIISSELRCDCDTLWAARTIQSCSRHVALEHVQCCGVPIGQVPLGALVCPTPCLLPAACSCTRWEADQGEVLRATCSNQTSVPALADQPGRVWELDLANNFIEELDPQHLSPNIQVLDVRYNKLSRIPPEVLRVLPRDARLSLEGNPLRCDCSIADTLANFITDWPCRPCPPGTTSVANPTILLSFLVPLVAVAGLLILCLSYPLTRRRIKRLVRDHFCPRPEPSNDLPYDVFLSYSHLDGDFVEELMKWLEKNEYRVCEHSRDWAPGAWIPAQIAASVQRSRCTVVVVSKNFVQSKWARAEFREAYLAALQDSRPRLVAVLLQEPGNLPLDKELRHYLKNNTYALWTDRYFWSKLRTALPTPRPCEQITIESELTPTLDKETVT